MVRFKVQTCFLPAADLHFTVRSFWQLFANSIVYLVPLLLGNTDTLLQTKCLWQPLPLNVEPHMNCPFVYPSPCYTIKYGVRLAWGNLCCSQRLAWGNLCCSLRLAWGNLCCSLRLAWGNLCCSLRLAQGTLCCSLRLAGAFGTTCAAVD